MPLPSTGATSIRTMKSVEHIFQNGIKPELNSLYRDRENPSAMFCREHAFHIYLLSLMLGFDASIVYGHVAAYDVQTGSTRDSFQRSDGSYLTDGHYWNRVGQHYPVDASISFRSWLKPEHDIGMVCDRDTSGIFDITTADIPGTGRTVMNTQSRSYVTYYRNNEICPDPEYLIDNPYSLLIKPAAAETERLHIFSKITLHLFDIASGRTSPFFKARCSQSRVLKLIDGRHKNARDLVLQIIERPSDDFCSIHP